MYVYSLAFVRHLSTIFAADFKTWQAKQYAHYKAHPSKEPKHAKLWKEIQEYCTHSSAGTTEHLSSRSASSMMMRVRDDFSTSVSFDLMGR
jgi:hypothetical protein